jgi:hypothetical protein
MSLARSQKSGVSRRVSQVVSLCGLRSKSVRIRSAWEEGIGANITRATWSAIAAWVQVAAGPIGMPVAAATRTRSS